MPLLNIPARTKRFPADALASDSSSNDRDNNADVAYEFVGQYVQTVATSMLFAETAANHPRDNIGTVHSASSKGSIQESTAVSSARSPSAAAAAVGAPDSDGGGGGVRAPIEYVGRSTTQLVFKFTNVHHTQQPASQRQNLAGDESGTHSGSHLRGESAGIGGAAAVTS